MDPDFIERMQRINLTAEEGEIIQVCPRQRERLLGECSLSLFGKFLTTKPINQRAAKNLLRTTWKFGSNLKIIDVGEGLFQFKFTMESQLVWVLKNGPWSFDNYYLLLRQWEKGMNASTINFTHCPLWVQVWGLPFELFSEDVAMDIGKGIGKLVEVDCQGVAADQAKFLRIRGEIPLDKPLQRGSKIKGPDGEVVWVAFKYERLISFCFRCGILGHEVKTCEQPQGTEGQENQYGEWMKAGFRQMEEPSSNKNNSQPQRRKAEPAERTQAESDRHINGTSEIHGNVHGNSGNHGMKEVNAISISGVNAASVMEGNSFPSITASSTMNLDVITEKGNNQQLDTEGLKEDDKMHLYSVPISINVATKNLPNPKPNAPPIMPKSRDHLSDKTTATKLNTTERKERAKQQPYRRKPLKKNNLIPTGPTIRKAGGKKRGLEVKEKLEISEKNTELESRKRQKCQDDSDNMQTTTAVAASQPHREQ
uniref:CCHC-type domain-containing protein n=1 Tax=Quercus lobata TaxID=97700 RepID=A0A7N2KTF6_QUELO